MHAPPSEPSLIAADAIIPMDTALPPVLHQAGIVVAEGHIAAIGELAELRRQHGELPLLRPHHKGIILPGLINAHTHLELGYQQHDKLDASSFPQWVSSLMAAFPPPGQLEQTLRTAAAQGARQSLLAGVTTLGDISRHAALTRGQYAAMQRESATPAVPRIISFGEVVALGRAREKLKERIEAALATPQTTAIDSNARPLPLTPGHPVVGISPHAPYTVEGPALQAVVRTAIIHRTPLCMHLAELAEETAFLRDLSGPLGAEWEVMRKMDLLDDAIPRYEGGPIRWAQRWGLLIRERRDFPTLLAHVNYCDDGDLAQLATHVCSVIYCPRTHEYFRHPPHRYREMLEAQVNVCLGTDSLASNPDLDILREARRLHQRDGILAYLALDLITRRPAAALGVLDTVGTLAPGKQADMVLYELEVPPPSGHPTANALAAQLLEKDRQPEAIYVGGVAVARG